MLLLTKARQNSMATNDIVIVIIIAIFSLSGLIGGFIKNTSKLFSFAGSILLSFYLGGWVSGLLIENIQAVKEFCETNAAGPTLILIASYILTFLVGLLFLKIIFKALQNILESNGFGKFLNSMLGLVSGALIGLVVADIYCWGLYAISCVNADVASWVIADARLLESGFQTAAKYLIEFNLSSINMTFPGM